MTPLLAFSTLPIEGPSVRPRVLAYESHLKAEGISLSLDPFLSSRGFRGFYSTSATAKARKAVFGALGYVRRIRELAHAGAFAGVLVHREIVPRWNGRAVRSLNKRGLSIAYDLDDAVYLSPRRFVDSREPSHRRMSRVKDPSEVDGLLAAADLVLAGNETIAEHASGFCRDVRVQPTPVDVRRFHPRPRPERERPLVGWIGSPTAAYCLKAIVPALSRAAREAPFDLLVVGAGERIEVPGVRVLDREWRLSEEPAAFASLDVGLYPLPDNAFTRGKCGMKALLYMASEVPAVVSPVGVNERIVSDGETGFFADDADEWVDRLLIYLKDPELRALHGRRGRERASAEWSVDALAGGFVQAMKDVVR